MIDRVQGIEAAALPQQPQKAQQPIEGGGFGQLMRQVQREAPQSPPASPEREPIGEAAGPTVESVINFSKHAMSRAQERGIELTPALMQALSGSVEKAQEKGAKNILAFNATQAFIINVPYGRVITTMNQDEMKENIFTNIDGAVLI